jgi:hypothetical protein
MLPFGVTIPATVPQGSEIPEGLMNNLVFIVSSVTAIIIINVTISNVLTASITESRHIVLQIAHFKAANNIKLLMNILI